MPSLSDIFNPTFLIFLGILVLVVSLLVVYIESKNREQNHKISTMFSLVSSLAEELNIIKNIIKNITNNDFIIHNGGSDNLNYTNQQFDNKSIFINKNDLIPVSDDEDSEHNHDDSESESNSDDSESNSDDSDDSESNSEDNELEIQSLNSSENLQDDNNFADIKFLKLNINNSLNETIITDVIDNLDEIDEIDDPTLVTSNLISSEKEALENTEEKEILDISSSDLKTININLEESNNDNIDYKKLSLTKLRSIVVEKSLSNETSKLKKADLLKLLGVE